MTKLFFPQHIFVIKYGKEIDKRVLRLNLYDIYRNEVHRSLMLNQIQT